MRLGVLGLLLILFHFTQAQESKVVVKGQVYGVNQTTDLLTLFVVSQEYQTGNFGNPDGTYEIKINRNDTILIGSIGYFTSKVCVKDSTLKDTIYVDVQLKQLQYYLQEVTVLAPREMRRIYEDIEKLGYDPKDDRLSGFVDPLSSPITALYEMYSRHARQERLAKKLINDAKRRDLLKELLAKYVDYNIIDLDDDQFDDFIEYLDVTDEFLKSSSQYDFIIFVKKKYQYYMRQHKYDGWESY
ncbi:hypothetical protein KFE94_13370 [bacterium SCSIO 12643]|nr:hypothetical protein KFE94_13370 [bacterium SCSIO 12643]